MRIFEITLPIHYNFKLAIELLTFENKRFMFKTQFHFTGSLEICIRFISN